MVSLGCCFRWPSTSPRPLPLPHRVRLDAGLLREHARTPGLDVLARPPEPPLLVVVLGSGDLQQGDLFDRPRHQTGNARGGAGSAWACRTRASISEPTTAFTNCARVFLPAFVCSPMWRFTSSQVRL